MLERPEGSWTWEYPTDNINTTWTSSCHRKCSRNNHQPLSVLAGTHSFHVSASTGIDSPLAFVVRLSFTYGIRRSPMSTVKVWWLHRKKEERITRCPQSLFSATADPTITKEWTNRQAHTPTWKARLSCRWAHLKGENRDGCLFRNFRLGEKMSDKRKANWKHPLSHARLKLYWELARYRPESPWDCSLPAVHESNCVCPIEKLMKVRKSGQTDTTN